MLSYIFLTLCTDFVVTLHSFRAQEQRSEGARPCASRRARGLTGAAGLYKLRIPHKRGDHNIEYSLFVLFFTRDKFGFC